MFKALYLFISLLTSIEYFTKPVKDSAVRLKQAIHDLHNIYTQGGIVEVIDSIDQCYKDLQKPKLYCFYLDYSARIWDALMIESLNSQTNSLYSTNEFLVMKTFKNVYI